MTLRNAPASTLGKRTPDLLVRNAILRGRPGLWRIAVTSGQIASVEVDDGDVGGAASELDAEGLLATEPFADGHLHLCKVNTFDLAGGDPLSEYTHGGMGGAMTAIERAAVVKETQTVARVVEGARKALVEAVRHGVRAVQAFVDVDPRAGLSGVQGVLQVREEFRGLVDVQIVAFPQDGLLREPGTEELIDEAVRLGVDVVGGIPWIEWTDADAAEHVRRMVDLAGVHDLRVAMLVDDAGDAGLRTTEMLATALLERGMIGRASAQHARAMSLYPEPYLRRLIGVCRAAGLGFVTDPHTGPLHLRFSELIAAGIPVALGQDDIEDAYYPFGRHNMLEVAFLAAHLFREMGDAELERIFSMITTNAARVLGRPVPQIAVGAPADFVILADRTIRKVLTNHEAPRHVVVGGRVVASSIQSTEFNFLPQG